MSVRAKEAIVENNVNEIFKSLALAALNHHFPEIDKYGNPSLSRFFFENGRLPYATDEIKPWSYRGWLIPYIQMCENLSKNKAMIKKIESLALEGKKPFRVPYISPRYDYVLRTLEAGKLLDEPIPQIEFIGEFEQATKPGLKMLNDCIDKIAYSSGYAHGIREFCEWLGFALGVTNERSKLDEDVQDFLYRNFNLEPLLIHPSDYLGQLLCESNHGKGNGFFPTPIHICSMMAEMVKADKKGSDPRMETTHDPCVGTGRMLLVSSNFSLRLYGQDIDYLCCLITKINLALYAPWHYIPECYFPEKTVETMKDSETELKNDSGSPDKPDEAHQEEVKTELSLYERLKIEKDGRKRQRKYTTVIDEQLTLF